jgi:hypothetical protein
MKKLLIPLLLLLSINIIAQDNLDYFVYNKVVVISDSSGVELRDEVVVNGVISINTTKGKLIPQHGDYIPVVTTVMLNSGDTLLMSGFDIKYNVEVRVLFPLPNYKEKIKYMTFDYYNQDIKIFYIQNL